MPLARFAILTLAGAGHLHPTGAIGRELLSRGHSVAVIASESARPITDRLELPLLPFADSPEIDRSRSLPLISALPGMRLSARLMRAAVQVLNQAPAMLRQFQADAVLVDQNVLAGVSVAEHLGLPNLTVCSAMMAHEEPAVPPHFTSWGYSAGGLSRLRNRLTYAGYHASIWPATRLINRYRRDWGLSPIRRHADYLSPYAQISQLVPEFDFPRADLPAVCHYVGSLARSRVADEAAFPWNRLDGRKLIYASLGTVSRATKANTRVYRTIAEACAGLEAQLVLAFGKWSEKAPDWRELVGELPGDPLIVDFAPQLLLLQRADLMITHGGQNTVLEAIHAGVPMIALPRGADQPALAARIEHAGIGLRDSFHRPDANRLRAKIRRVLSDKAFRQRMAEVRAAVVSAGGASYAADVAERVLVERRPITRDMMRHAAGLQPIELANGQAGFH